MMKLLLLAVWMVSCSCAVMPPTNLTVESQNFNHTLHWIPAAGTPPGTEYCIYLSDDDNQSDTLLSVTRATSLPVSVFMKEDIYKMYTLSVRAKIYNHTGCVPGYTTNPAQTTFEPYTTVLGPPVVHVEGCGDCLLVNSALPCGDGIKPAEIRTFSKSVTYNIQWKKADEDMVRSLPSKHNQTKISNLNPGERYCLKVALQSTNNPNTLPSDWQCAWTSPAPRPAGLYLLFWSAGTVCVGVLLMMLSAGLYYSGAICRPKLKLPQNLVLLVTGFFLSPETVDFDAVCVSSDCVLLAQRGRTPARKHPLSDGAHSEDEEDEQEEDEDGTENCGYMDRAAPPSASSQDALGPDATAEQYYGSCSPTGNVEQLQGQPGVEGHAATPLPRQDNTQPNTGESDGQREEWMERERKRDGEREEWMERERKRDGEREDRSEAEKKGDGEREQRDGEREQRDGEREQRDGERGEADAHRDVNLDVGSGDVNLGSGDVNLGSGDVNLGSGDVNLGSGSGDVNLGSGDVNLGSGDVNLGSGDVNLGSGDVNLGSGDVNLGSVRLGGLKETEQEKEEEEDEDQPLLNLQNTHTDTHTWTDTHTQGRTETHPWTELREHTHTPTQTDPSHTLPLAEASHTDAPLLDQVMLSRPLGSGSHTHTHSDTSHPHTHSHTHTHPHTHPHTHSHSHSATAPVRAQLTGTGSDWSNGHSDRGSPDTGYLATHKGSVYSHAATDEDEEEEEEEDYSGYMTRQ
ncbi:uncharacterized protein LOC143100035 isoform X2 [Alosa pseudoharengus]|uniref:uncharacterized protein LOC143100035 isoform X2 n=1 Tax=Alosa pseudoharengus TaxID=34774 RepID=UPI003F8931C9